MFEWLINFYWNSIQLVVPPQAANLLAPLLPGSSCTLRWARRPLDIFRRQLVIVIEWQVNKSGWNQRVIRVDTRKSSIVTNKKFVVFTTAA
jgi:hypothetical protein